MVQRLFTSIAAMLVIKAWYDGELVLRSSARQDEKVLDLYTKLGNTFLGKLFARPCADMADMLTSLQDQAAKLMKHEWCCSKDVVLFVGGLRITPPGFASVQRLTATQARKVSRVLHATRVEMLWDETDSAWYTSNKRNNNFDVFGFLARQVKRAMLEQSYVDLESMQVGNEHKGAKTDVLVARHHLSSERFSQACALWGVQADFPTAHRASSSC